MSLRCPWLGLVLAVCSCSGTAANQTDPGSGGSAAGGNSGAGGGTTTGGSDGGSAGLSAGGTTGAGGHAGTAAQGGGAVAGGANGGNGGNPSGGGASGGSASGGSASGGSASGGGSSFADVQAIFNDRCVTCHDKSLNGLPRFPQLSLTPSDAHAALYNKAATETCGGILVVPGDPDKSYLLKKVTEATPCEGQRMPRPFEILPSPPLTDAQLATLRAWISAGAKP